MATTNRSAAYITIDGAPAWELRERDGEEQTAVRVRRDFDAAAWVRGEATVTQADILKGDG
jgi:hypothetical protein